ncbi:hypothetical protein AMTRI_Chr12g237640 [Amborella trichopoda]
MMAATGTFTRNPKSFSHSRHAPPPPGLKIGPNGTPIVSTGIQDLDHILFIEAQSSLMLQCFTDRCNGLLGGGVPVGSLIMVMEDSEAPHHLLLLRNFMSQGVLHRQPLLYASPAHSPRAFLGTLPAPIPPRTHLHTPSQQQVKEEDLRIAWQYKKYFGNEQMFVESHRVHPITQFATVGFRPCFILITQFAACVSSQSIDLKLSLSLSLSLFCPTHATHLLLSITKPPCKSSSFNIIALSSSLIFSPALAKKSRHELIVVHSVGLRLWVSRQQELLAEVVMMICYLINRSPSTALGEKTPQEVWSGTPCDYSN